MPGSTEGIAVYAHHSLRWITTDHLVGKTMISSLGHRRSQASIERIMMSATALDTSTSAASEGVIRSRTGVPRLCAALFVGSVAVFAPCLGTAIALLPARVAQIAPADKVNVVAILTAATAVVSFLTLVTVGALSDRTRSRLGRRNPWVLGGALGTAAATLIMAFADSLPVLTTGFLLQGIAVNVVLGALGPIVPDRVPGARRGIASTALGAGTLIGGTVGVLTSSVFASDPGSAFVVLAIIAVILGVAFVFLAPDFSTRDEPRTSGRFSPFSSLSFPRNAKDFYWAFAGRLGVMLGYYTVAGYQLYVLTDYIGLDASGAAKLLGAAAVVNLVGSLFGALVSGPLSDFLGRRKIITASSGVIIGLGVLIPAFVNAPWAFLAYTGVAGMGLGMYLSVDAALLSQLLPSSESRGKDLAIGSLPTNGGQLVGPLVGSVILGTGVGFTPVFVIASVLCVVGASLIVPIRSVR